jgi:ornithine cyclodeaminase/alanine dehydrogenase-like protein (mu-crystallin family)
MRERVSCPLEPVASSAEVIQGSDIVVAVTDAIGPVIDGSLLQSGTHVTLSRYFELDPEGWRRCDLVIEGARPQDGDASYWSKQIWDNRYVIGGQDKVKGTSLAFRSTEFTATHARHIAFPDIILGKQSGRLRDEEISCFYISNPSGVQLAYLGAFIVEQAKRLGLGRELPSEWFSEAEKD